MEKIKEEEEIESSEEYHYYNEKHNDIVLVPRTPSPKRPTNKPKSFINAKYTYVNPTLTKPTLLNHTPVKPTTAKRSRELDLEGLEKKCKKTAGTTTAVHMPPPGLYFICGEEGIRNFQSLLSFDAGTAATRPNSAAALTEPKPCSLRWKLPRTMGAAALPP